MLTSPAAWPSKPSHAPRSRRLARSWWLVEPGLTARKRVARFLADQLFSAYQAEDMAHRMKWPTGVSGISPQADEIQAKCNELGLKYDANQLAPAVDGQGRPRSTPLCRCHGARHRLFGVVPARERAHFGDHARHYFALMRTTLTAATNSAANRSWTVASTAARSSPCAVSSSKRSPVPCAVSFSWPGGAGSGSTATSPPSVTSCTRCPIGSLPSGVITRLRPTAQRRVQLVAKSAD
jgi:hypothetical protein